MLQNYKPLAQAISALLFPYAEVVIHCLETEKIVFISNPSSKRKIGDPSELQSQFTQLTLPDYYPPYIHFDDQGQRWKSTTIVIKEHDKPIYLFCINLDVAVWEKLGARCMEFIQGTVSIPTELYQEDWKETIRHTIYEKIKHHSWHPDQLTKDQAKTIVKHLHQKGLFSVKRSIPFTCQFLNLSRATLYRYVKEVSNVS